MTCKEESPWDQGHRANSAEQDLTSHQDLPNIKAFFFFFCFLWVWEGLGHRFCFQKALAVSFFSIIPTKFLEYSSFKI